jgi:signal transduction histidine kinase
MRRLWVEVLIALPLPVFRCGAIAVLCLALWFASMAGVAAGEGVGSGEVSTSRRVNADSNSTNGLGSWIWADRTYDRQTCLFWRSFEVPSESPVLRARIVMTVDNDFTPFLDGREMGRGDELHELFVYDVTPLMSPGTHILAVNAYNATEYAGMIFGMRVDLADGKVIEVKSDQSWRIVPNGTKDWKTRKKALAAWPRATIMAPLGGSPWWKMPTKVNFMPVLQPGNVFFWQTGWFQITLLFVLALAIVISLRLFAQLALHRKEQWLLQRERARIAMDFHDDLGSRMTKLVLHGEVVQGQLPSDSETRLRLEKICEEARGILSTMDEILWAVNPKRDAFGDFISYVCGYAQELFKPTRIQCVFDMDPVVSDLVLNLPQKRALLMVLKEALNNVMKHSEATELALKIKWQARKLIVVVSDNGKGFDTTALKPGGNGLINMTQRAGELGGTCLITSQPGKGCRTEFSIPLKQSRWRGWNWLERFTRFRVQLNTPQKV